MSGTARQRSGSPELRWPENQSRDVRERAVFGAPLELMGFTALLLVNEQPPMNGAQPQSSWAPLRSGAPTPVGSEVCWAQGTTWGTILCPLPTACTVRPPPFVRLDRLSPCAK